MKFDMNRAWRDATTMVSANREILLALGGIFFFLPGLAVLLLIPSMQPPADLEGQEAMTQIIAFYRGNALWIILVGIAQVIGMLTVLALLSNREKLTVREALKTGAVGLLPYLGAQLLASLCIGALAALIVSLTAATGLGPLVAAGVVAALALTAYALTKISLFPPVIAIERVYNPVAVITRSWVLTRGNSFRLFLFYLLILVTFIVLMAIISITIGTALALLGDGSAALIGNAVVSGITGTVATVYFVAVIAAVHRQLASPSPETAGRTFG